jgi:hypothetical protein
VRIRILLKVKRGEQKLQKLFYGIQLASYTAGDLNIVISRLLPQKVARLAGISEKILGVCAKYKAKVLEDEVS